MSRVSARFRDGSPPSSPLMTCTGWPLMPPRAFTDLDQTWIIGCAAPSAPPTTPPYWPTLPSLMTDPVAVPPEPAAPGPPAPPPLLLPDVVARVPPADVAA